MKCANHIGADAVGICNGCSRALCPECQVGDESVLCAACLTARNNQVMRHFATQLAISGGLLVGTLVVLKDAALPWHQLGAMALMMAFLPFGWSALSRFFNPGGGYFNPATRWLSLLFHFAVAAMLGWLVGPWQIYKAIREIRKGRVANASVAAR